MKNPCFLLLTLLMAGSVSAQTDYFEGRLFFKSRIHTTTDQLSDADVKLVTLFDDSTEVYIKGSKEYSHAARWDFWTICEDKMTYHRFAGIDTLYYEDCSIDTSTVLDLEKGEVAAPIMGYKCKSLTIRTYQYTVTRYYTPSLSVDPVYRQRITKGHMNMTIRETKGGLNLWAHTIGPFSDRVDSSVRIVPGTVNDRIFELPKLPMKEYKEDELVHAPRPRMDPDAWLQQIDSRLDKKLAAKFVRIPAGQTEASVELNIEFLVGVDGRLSQAHAIGDVGGIAPQLVAEACRAVLSSEPWEPGICLYRPFACHMRAPITFFVKAAN